MTVRYGTVSHLCPSASIKMTKSSKPTKPSPSLSTTPIILLQSSRVQSESPRLSKIPSSSSAEIFPSPSASNTPKASLSSEPSAGPEAMAPRSARLMEEISSSVSGSGPRRRRRASRSRREMLEKGSGGPPRRTVFGVETEEEEEPKEGEALREMVRVGLLFFFFCEDPNRDPTLSFIRTALHCTALVNNMQHSKLLLLLLLAIPSLFFSSGQPAKVPAIIVFGDSTVDTGNNNRIPTLLKSNFHPYGRDFAGGRPTGRFCNGRLAPDFISEALGLPAAVPAYLDPAYGIEDFATGVCFASAGTGFDNATSDVLSVIPLWKEVEYFREYQRRLRRYMGREKAEWTVREAIYIISIGTNDFLENYYSLVTGRFKQFTVAQFQDFILGLAADFVTDIYRLGARKISFTSLGPIGCLPLERTTNAMRGGACIEDYNKVARDFNVKLQAKIAELCAALPGIRLRYTSPYESLLHMITNPTQYGMDNAHEGCCNTGKFEMGYLCNDWNPRTCRDADKYVFWDSFHPTEKVNRIMADLTLNTSLAEFI